MSENTNTPLTVAAIAALRAGITAGEWEYDRINKNVTAIYGGKVVCDVGEDWETDSDGFFIAAAPAAIDRLLALVDLQTRQLARAKEGLLAVGNLADRDADQRVWIVRDTLVDIERMETEASDGE